MPESIPVFLSKEWLDLAVSILKNEPFANEFIRKSWDDGGDFLVKYLNQKDSDDEIAHFQRWRGGHLVEWNLDETVKPDVIIERSIDAEYECWCGNPDPAKIVNNTFVSVSEGKHNIVIPFDINTLTEAYSELDTVLNSDFVAEFNFSDYPWGGNLNYGIHFISGKPVEVWVGTDSKGLDIPKPDFTMNCAFPDGVGFLIGVQIYRDFFSNSTLVGSHLSTSQISGLTQMPRTTKAFAHLREVSRPYLALISRMRCANFDGLRKKLSKTEKSRDDLK